MILYLLRQWRLYLTNFVRTAMTGWEWCNRPCATCLHQGVWWHWCGSFESYYCARCGGIPEIPGWHCRMHLGVPEDNCGACWLDAIHKHNKDTEKEMQKAEREHVSDLIAEHFPSEKTPRKNSVLKPGDCSCVKQPLYAKELGAVTIPHVEPPRYLSKYEQDQYNSHLSRELLKEWKYTLSPLDDGLIGVPMMATAFSGAPVQLAMQYSTRSRLRPPIKELKDTIYGAV